MSLGILFWLLMVLWLVLGLWSTWPNLRAGSPNILLFLILMAVGWKLFGPPINS